jgi:protoheme IX farnesyltransferase
MTHFFAIGIFRLKDYAAAKLPVMPVYLGILRTKVLMVIYAFLFAYAAFALFLVEQLGLVYSVPVGIFSIGWVVLGVSGFYAKDDSSWACRTFSYSIILLLVFSISLALS